MVAALQDAKQLTSAEAEGTVEKLMMMARAEGPAEHVGVVGSVTHIDDGDALQPDALNMAVEEVSALDRLIRSEHGGVCPQPVSLDGLVEEVKG